jgi:hypothetical protein
LPQAISPDTIPCRFRDGAIQAERSAKRHSDDPKQADKASVHECWKLWQSEPERYKIKAAFALDMLTKFESLKNQRVVERWCKQWESKSSPSPEF